jgi:hypothetical protein
MRYTQFLSLAVLIIAVLLFYGSAPQAKGSKGIDQSRHMQLMEMMQDSTMLYLMMDHIASNNAMSSMMMGKMIQRADNDSVWMNNMLGMMYRNQAMHSMMMQMMGGMGTMHQGHAGMMNQGGMMMQPYPMKQNDSKTSHQ